MIYAWNHMLLPYRAVTSFLPKYETDKKAASDKMSVNALSGCYLISTQTVITAR